MMLLQQLNGLADDIAAATSPGGRPACLDAHHAVVALIDEVVSAQLCGVEIDLLEDVDDGRHQTFGQREGRIVLGVAADLKYALAELRESDRQVGRGRALADAALAIDREYFCGPDDNVRIHLDLHAAGT